MIKIKKSQELLDSLRMGDISVSYYDMGWVLRSDVLGIDIQSKILNKIENNQLDDGSWGGSIEYIHDRVINTLSVIVALYPLEPLNKAIIEKGLYYLQKNIPLLTEELTETIGFELNFPRLLQDAQKLGIDLPYHCEAVTYYILLGVKKKNKVTKALFSKPTTLLHSLEGFGENEIDYDAIKPFSNGSIGNSPAATAAYIMRIGKKKAQNSINYLKQFKELDWEIPSIYPFEIFEKAWVLYNFLHAGILHRLDYKKHADYLWEHWKQFNGASISNTFPIIDSDDTAVVYIVLKETGYPVLPEVFEQFEEDLWFRCFDLERNPSISANIHILDAIVRSKEYNRRDQVIKKIINFLKSKIGGDGLWRDKWHISPFYTTSHLGLAVKDVAPDLYKKLVLSLLNAQNNDGGWGENESTFEETSYVLQAFSVYKNNFEKNFYLEWGQKLSDLQNKKFDESLWVDKGVYTPTKVIESILSKNL